MELKPIRLSLLDGRRIRSDMYYSDFTSAMARAVLWCGLNNQQRVYVIESGYNVRWVVGTKNNAMISSPPLRLVWDNDNVKKVTQWKYP